MKGKLIACLKELGVKIKVENFQDKLVVQKIACLLQLKGIDLGYNFSIYVRGPYSSDLTKELYSNKTDFEQLKTNEKLTLKEKEWTHKLKELTQLKPSTLEIAATYALLFKETGSTLKAILKTRKLKAFYGQIAIGIAVNKIKPFIHTLSEKDERELLKEFSSLEAASIEALSKNVN